MYRYLVSVFVFALMCGCSTIQPISAVSTNELKSGKSSVALYDDAERINFLEDKYLVLAVAQVASNSEYQGMWDGSKDISALHATEFSRIGVPAHSIYDNLTESGKAELKAMQKEMHAALVAEKVVENRKELSPYLNPQLRQRLLDNGDDYLIWMTWSGYLMHIQTLGLPPTESFVTNYWIHDLKKNQTVWHGSIGFRETIDLKGVNGKAFLEKDNLAGLKAQVATMIAERYKIRSGRGVLNDSVGQIIGIEPKK